MRSLTAAEIIRVWEAGLPLAGTARAVALLAAAMPDRPAAELDHLSLGERDGLLLELRQALFGARAEAYAECPACGERLEYGIDVAQLRAQGAAPLGPEAFMLETEAGLAVRFRAVTSADLTAVAGLGAGPGEIRRALAGRCVLEATRKGDPTDLTDDEIGVLAARMAQADPLAEVLLEMACPACGHAWQVLFDTAAYLSTELNGRVRQLLRDVHLLASAYGWSEEAILGLSDARRLYYLELVAL